MPLKSDKPAGIRLSQQKNAFVPIRILEQIAIMIQPFRAYTHDLSHESYPNQFSKYFSTICAAKQTIRRAIAPTPPFELHFFNLQAVDTYESVD